jgi:hypothetical protein
MRASAQFLTSKCITVMPQNPYSPDITPCDLLIFQKLKTGLKGQHFESKKDIQQSVTQVLNDAQQNTFQQCYKQWQHRWNTFVQAQGMCFEGGHIVGDE